MTNIQLEKSFNNLSSEYRIFLKNHHDEEKPALLNPSENLNIAMNNFRRDINNCTENDKKRLLHLCTFKTPIIYNFLLV